MYTVTLSDPIGRIASYKTRGGVQARCRARVLANEHELTTTADNWNTLANYSGCRMLKVPFTDKFSTSIYITIRKQS